jgi:hypothetical protein
MACMDHLLVLERLAGSDLACAGHRRFYMASCCVHCCSVIHIVLAENSIAVSESVSTTASDSATLQFFCHLQWIDFTSKLEVCLDCCHSNLSYVSWPCDDNSGKCTCAGSNPSLPRAASRFSSELICRVSGALSFSNSMCNAPLWL